MKDDHNIIWEKWRDPFIGYDENDIDIDNGSLDFFDEDSEDINNEELLMEKNNIAKQVRVISTPMGLIPYNEYTASGKIFNFWIGHTNFNISPVVAQKIEQTEGVETLDVFTRYRFRISIGKAFESRDVMLNIESQIKP